MQVQVQVQVQVQHLPGGGGAHGEAGVWGELSVGCLSRGSRAVMDKLERKKTKGHGSNPVSEGFFFSS